jgi:hypothetical protein
MTRDGFQLSVDGPPLLQVCVPLTEPPLPVTQAPTNYQQSFQQSLQPLVMHGPWFGPPKSIVTLHAPHLAALPLPPPLPLTQRTPPTKKVEDWDKTYVAMLGTPQAGS